MSFLDELERAIEVARTKMDDPQFRRTEEVRFLATHGPRLLAAVRLSEAFDKRATSVTADEDQDSSVVQFINGSFAEAWSAYRATVVSEPGNIDRGGV